MLTSSCRIRARRIANTVDKQIGMGPRRRSWLIEGERRLGRAQPRRLISPDADDHQRRAEQLRRADRLLEQHPAKKHRVITGRKCRPAPPSRHRCDGSPRTPATPAAPSFSPPWRSTAVNLPWQSQALERPGQQELCNTQCNATVLAQVDPALPRRPTIFPMPIRWGIRKRAACSARTPDLGGIARDSQVMHHRQGDARIA